MSSRTDIEIAFLRARIWQLEAYATLPQELLEQPATQDEFDPASWWTPKDHLAHCGLMTEAISLIIRHHVQGGVDPSTLVVGERIAIQDPETMASFASLEDLFPVVHGRTHELWREYRDVPLDGVLALGERTRAELLGVLGSLTEEQLGLEVIPRGPARWTVGQQIAQLHNHDKLHWGWALTGLARRAEVLTG